MPARPFVVAGTLVILLGGAAIGYAVTRNASGGMTESQSAAMAGAVGKLDGDINAARAAVHTSATQLSNLLAVRASVSTDAKTVADQVAHGELAVTLDKGDILALGRILKAGNAVEELMVLPAGAMHIAHDGIVGRYADLVDDKLVITEIAKVEPAQGADQMTGFLAVSRPLPLAPALQPLIAAGITGKLVVGSKSAPIGAMPADAATTDRPLSAAEGAKLVVAEPPARAVMPLPILVGGIAAAIIGLLLLVISLVDKRGADYSRAFTAAQPAQAQDRKSTRLNSSH